MSYTIDVYRNQLKPSREIVSFLAFVSFFPQLVAGPIERAINLLPQFYKTRLFNYDQAVMGIRYMLWGFFKKIVIADNCAPFVNDVFANPQSASSLELIVGAIFFAFQIYCDFSGYSDIAMGVAKLFGFELMVNFKTPYFSRDMAEFWRRWHISLSTWFRDYLYFPLGGSKLGKLKTIRNTFIIFIVSGFWHGANWTFIFWGFLHAVFFIPLLIRGTNRNHLDTVASTTLLPTLKEGWQVSLTFTLCCFAWIFFRADNLQEAFSYCTNILYNNFLPNSVDRFKLWLFPILLLWLVAEWMSRCTSVPYLINSFHRPFVRYSFYCLIILILGLFGAFQETAFIYFQF